MKLGIPREIHAGERRVAATPQNVMRLKALGFDVMIEAGAGNAAGFSDGAYAEAGATIVPDAPALWSTADLVLKVREPEFHPGVGRDETELLREGGRLICFIWPAHSKALLDRLAARRATVLAVDCIPRITRAQKMDALSSMAGVAGYRAVIEAAHHYPRFFAGQITAAGKIDPAKILVIGAGVAGLSAIGAARSLGALVRAFDTREVVRDQVRSMGAEFLHLDHKEEGSGDGGYAKEMTQSYIQAETALFAAQAMEVDIIITTALVPGKRAPQLITAGMVESMKPGSVIVDMAAEQGGNCTLTRPGQAIVHKDVTIIGFTDLPSRMASQSSQLYGSNLVHMLDEMGGATSFRIDHDNEVVRGALVLDDGRLTWPPPRPKAPPDPVMAERLTGTEGDRPAGAPRTHAKAAAGAAGHAWLLIAGLALLAIGAASPPSFLAHLTVFILACFVGWQVVWNVTPALHTPLMSVTNAISGIIIIGGMLQLTGGLSAPAILGAAAVLLATINIAGGFLVTRRMLAMFHR